MDLVLQNMPSGKPLLAWDPLISRPPIWLLACAWDVVCMSLSPTQAAPGRSYTCTPALSPAAQAVRLRVLRSALHPFTES